MDLDKTQSLELMICAVKIILNGVAWFRKLFPEDSFADQRFVPDKVLPEYRKGLTNDYIQIKTLVKRKYEDVDEFMDWVEEVVEAIKNKYLNGFILGIYLDKSKPLDMLEVYHFKVDYSLGTINIDGVLHLSYLDARRGLLASVKECFGNIEQMDPLPKGRRYLTMRMICNNQSICSDLFEDVSLKRSLRTRGVCIKSSSVDALHSKLSIHVQVEDENESYNNSNVHEKPLKKRKLIKETLPAESQITKELQIVLKPPSPVEATQQVHFYENENPEMSCECGYTATLPNDVCFRCKTCDSKVHGNCYNIRGVHNFKCIACHFEDLESLNVEALSAMLNARKIYYHFCRDPTRQFPPLLSTFYEQIAGLINDFDHINNGMSALFRDGIFEITSQLDTSSSFVDVDIDGIYYSDGSLLEKGRYIIRFNKVICTAYLEPVKRPRKSGPPFYKRLQDIPEIIEQFINGDALDDDSIDDSTDSNEYTHRRPVVEQDSLLSEPIDSDETQYEATFIREVSSIPQL